MKYISCDKDTEELFRRACSFRSPEDAERIRELEKELAKTKQLYKAGCEQWNPVYETTLARIRELEETNRKARAMVEQALYRQLGGEQRVEVICEELRIALAVLEGNKSEE